jgi:hypothetical protein
VARAVAVVDLGQAVVHRDVLAVGAGGHVAEGQRVGQVLRGRGELAGQDVGEAAFFGFDDGAGVVRDQGAQQGFGVLDVAEVAGAVQAVQAGFGEFGDVAARVRPEELGTVYPHRWAVPRKVWVRLFGSAEHEIAILAYSTLFLAEDAGILRILADKSQEGVIVRIVLGDPDGPQTAMRGEEEGTRDAVGVKIRNALTLYRPLCGMDNIEIRLHRTVLYNSIYRADHQLLVNQHTYGAPAAQAPVFCLSNTSSGDMAALYFDSFERVWASATPLQ